MRLYKPVQSNRLYEHIVVEIEQRILSGALEDGDRFPSEVDLADQFGVSRTVVREAMKVLRQKGLVKVQPGRGTFVTNTTQQAVRRSLDLMLRIENVGGLRNVAEARAMFEPPIAAMAAQRCSDDDIATLAATLVTMEALMREANETQSPLSVQRFIEADLEFHLTLARATENPLVELLLNSFVGLQRDHRRRLIVQPGAAERAVYHHQRVLEAVRQRDADAAHDAMRAHLATVYDRSALIDQPNAPTGDA